MHPNIAQIIFAEKFMALKEMPLFELSRSPPVINITVRHRDHACLCV